ncbi:MAG: S8 family serine peptidase, partial [Streptosporangiaceae bacterium]
MSLGFPYRAQAGAAVGLVVACLALNAAPVFAAGSSVRSQEWWLRELHVTQAQQSAQAKGITVAVLDTGVDRGQADLAGSVVTGPDYTDSGRVRSGPFWGIHGTAMASLIAGHGHGRGRGAGILGIAPNATILSVRVTLESDDPLLSDANIAATLPGAIARGIRYAVRHHATVIALPLDPVTTTAAPGAGGSTAEHAAVRYALAHRVVLVAPAGDNVTGADPVNFPAAYRGVISVGAFNSAFIKAPFSSRQPYVTLTAAGDGVIAANGQTGYAQVSSTSAASAVVAGIVALIRAQFPALSPAQVTKALTESTVFRPRGGQQTGSGAGTVDAAAALAAAARMVEAVPTPGSSPASAAPAAPPPSPPAVHKSSGLGKTLLIDVGIAVAVFLVLAVPILGYGRHRRRRARAARLAEVRAAAQPRARSRPVARPARQVASARIEPEEHTYIPAPVSAAPPAAGPPPANGAATGAPSPWDSRSGSPGGPPRSGPPRSGPPGSGFQGSAFTASAFPRTGRISTSRAAEPPGAGAPAATGGWPAGAGSARAGSAHTGPAHAGLAHTEPADAAPAHTGPADGGPADRGPAKRGRAGGGPAHTGQAAGGTAGRGPADGGPGQSGPAPSGPAHAGPAHAGPRRVEGILRESAPGGAAADKSGPAALGTAAGGLIGSPRTETQRTPKVSGGPPWGPAPAPAGDVPGGRPRMPPAAGARPVPPGPAHTPAQPTPGFL